MADEIANTLDLTPINHFKETTKEVTVYGDEKQPKEPKKANLKTVQDGLLNIIEVGEDAMEKLAHIADSSELSSDFEALTKIMKELRETNKDLLEIEKTQLDIEKKKNGGVDPVHPTKIVHNTIFTGSSKDALDELRKLKETDNGKN